MDTIMDNIEEISENKIVFEKIVTEITKCGLNIYSHENKWIIDNKRGENIIELDNDILLIQWWKDNSSPYMRECFLSQLNNIKRAVLSQVYPLKIVNMLDDLKQFSIKELSDTIYLPSGYRIGQYIFNLLEFIRKEEGENASNTQNHRLADTFHIQNGKMLEYIQNFNNKINE